MSSDQTTSIFTNTQTQATPEQNNSVTSNNATTQANDPLADLLKDIKNESGVQKYANTQEALKGLQHAQTYIPQLKTELSQKDQELAQLRDEVNRLKAVEAVVERLTSQQNTPAPEYTTQTQAMDESKIAELVARTMSQHETKKTMQANQAAVIAKFQTAYGADAEKVFYSKANDLGMSQEEINIMAAKNPKAVYALFGIDGKQPERMTNPVVSSVNTQGFQPQKDTFIKKNDKTVQIGATSYEMIQEHRNAKNMVEELSQRGLTIDDLTKPSNYFNVFK